jgi:RimJ/RimL family protein N-acetyltransferase
MIDFDLNRDYILEDKRVLLRPLLNEDIDHLIPFSLHEPEIWKYSLLNAAGEENMRKYFDLAQGARVDRKEYPFIVFDKKTGRYAGTTRYYDMQLAFQTLQLGYTWYGRDFQGTGLNRHCKFLLLQFAFEEMDIVRVEFRADNNNKRSIAAMKSIGCIEEGVLREHLPTHDHKGRRDSIVLSILKSEWENTVKDKLRSSIQP